MNVVNLLSSFKRGMNGEVNEMICSKLSLLSFISLHFICPIACLVCFVLFCFCASPFSPVLCLPHDSVVVIVCHVTLRDWCLDVLSLGRSDCRLPED